MEFALVLPVFLAILGGALDLGRLFYASVTIENAAREGALFGASNPRCDTSARDGCSDPHTVTWHVVNEAAGLPDLSTFISCLHAGAAVPVTSCQPGDTYEVHLHSRFDFVTPLLGSLLGSKMTLHSTARAEVSVGAFDPDATPIPIPTPTPTPAPTPTPTGTPDPTPVTCLVPDFVGTRKNSAVTRWSGAGFSGAVTFLPGSGNYTIAVQSKVAGSSHPCTAGIEVGP